MYEPGKDEADPLDYLSRHPLPETGDDSIKKIIRWTVNTEHAVVVTGIRENTPKEEVMQKLEEKREGGPREAQARQIPGTTPLREARVVHRRRTNFETAAYSATSNPTEERCQARTNYLGHLGKTNTKQLLREKYQFPLMNSMIDAAINQCYECEVAIQRRREKNSLR